MESKLSMKKEKIISANTKEQFIKEIEKKPELLDNLSNDRLKVLEDYYDELIEQAEKKVVKLKGKK